MTIAALFWNMVTFPMKSLCPAGSICLYLVYALTVKTNGVLRGELFPGVNVEKVGPQRLAPMNKQ